MPDVGSFLRGVEAGYRDRIDRWLTQNPPRDAVEYSQRACATAQSVRRLGLPLRGRFEAGDFTDDGESYVALARGSLTTFKRMLWSGDLGSLRERVRDVVNRDFTRGEWAQFVPGQPYVKSC